MISVYALAPLVIAQASAFSTHTKSAFRGLHLEHPRGHTPLKRTGDAKSTHTDHPGRHVPLERTTDAKSAQSTSTDAVQEDEGDLHPEHPRVLVSEGCSMSSEVFRTAGELMNIHGLSWNGLGQSRFDSGGVKWRDEALKPDKNPFYSSKKGMGKAFMEGYTIAREELNTTLGIKVIADLIIEGEQQNVKWDEVLPTLLKLNTNFVQLQRKNTLDVVVCKLQDCFYSGKPRSNYGAAVDETGGLSDLCFARRFSDTRTMVNINADLLVRLLAYEEHRINMTAGQFQKAGVAIDAIGSEDLLDYETHANVKTSVSAWAKFLQSWGIQPDIEKIAAHLKTKQDPAHRFKPSSHRESIYNFDEVRKAMNVAPEYMRSFLRE